MKCKNCKNEFQGNFCNQCGQNNRVNKLTLKTFLEELSDSIFQINHGLFFTIKNLFIRPGHSIREFLDGKRKEYFKPIAFVLTLSTVYFLVSQFSDSPTLIDDFLSGYSDGEIEKGITKQKSPIIFWLSDNYAYTTLLLIPIFSLASYISFLGLKRNYLEHIVINSFVTGQQAIFYSIFMVIGVLSGKEYTTTLIAVIVSMLFNFWTYNQFFSKEKNGLVILRCLLAYFLFYIFFFITLFPVFVLSVKQ